MATANTPGSNRDDRDDRAELISDFLRTSRDMIATQRDVLLAFLSDGPSGRLVWQPAESIPDRMPARWRRPRRRR